MYQILNDEPMSIFGDGNQTRAFSYIDDIISPLWNSAVSDRASKEIINLGGVREYSINDANDILSEITGYNKKVYLEARHEVKNSIPTWKKSEEILEFKHDTELEEGLKRMWEWALLQPKRERFIWPNYELDKGIYAFWK